VAVAWFGLRKLKSHLQRTSVRLMNIWSDWPSSDLLIAAFFVASHLFLVYVVEAGNILHWADQSQRLAVYAAGAGMMSLIAGFTGTAIAQYGSSSGPVVAAIRSAHGTAIRRNWLNISGWLLVGTVLCLVAMSIDTKVSPRGSEWLFEIALTLAILKFVRLIFLFGMILSSLDQELEHVPRTKIGIRKDLKPLP
jgi:uncharacterized membrane protein